VRIVVGVDGSRQAFAGARWVAQLPLGPEDEVVIAAVVQQPVLVGAWGYIHTAANTARQERAWSEERLRLRRAAGSAAGELDRLACPVRTEVRDGHPVAALCAIASEVSADLVVVGPHGRGRLESILLGSVSQSLLHAMPTSVLIAREPVRAPARVLLATDGSLYGDAATRFLAGFLLPADPHIDVVVATGGRIGTDRSEEVARARQVADDAIASLFARGRAAFPMVRIGDAENEILAAACELGSDLLVTGARGLGGFSALVLGSVSRGLSKTAPCSVLVVRHNPGAGA
jgi:nucleotide-binding universal stress UspA family protein